MSEFEPVMEGEIVEPRPWDVLVSEGRSIQNAVNWKLGDLALEVEIGYREESLQRYAKEIDVAYETLKQYRTVARAYKIGDRSTDRSWTVHAIFASQADRYELIQSWTGTVRDARKLVAERNKPKTELPDAEPEPEPKGESEIELIDQTPINEEELTEEIDKEEENLRERIEARGGALRKRRQSKQETVSDTRDRWAVRLNECISTVLSITNDPRLDAEIMKIDSELHTSYRITTLNRDLAKHVKNLSSRFKDLS